MMAPVLEVLGGHFNDAAIAHSGDMRLTTWGVVDHLQGRGTNWSEFELAEQRQQTTLAV